MQVLFASSISAIYIWGFYKFLHILFRDSNDCIHWQVGGVLNRLNDDPLNSVFCAFANILITFFWVVNSLFHSIESP